MRGGSYLCHESYCWRYRVRRPQREHPGQQRRQHRLPGRRRPHPAPMSGASAAEDSPPLTRTRQFWVLLGYAVALGVVGALASLVFMGVIGFGDNWYVVANPGWFGGQWWWIAVTAGAGVLVGLLRRVTRLPDHTPGLIADLQEGRVEPRLVPGIVAVSAVSLIGGASLGPEKALGSIGGGAGTWVSRRRGLSAEDSQVNTLAGFGGAYGGLFSSTVIVVMMIMEMARPGGRRFTKALAGAIVASSVSFAIYFAIAGAVFLDAYPVPHYQFQDWQLLAAVPLGLFAAVVTALLGPVRQALGRAVRSAEAAGRREIHARRGDLRAGRGGTATDPVHRQRPT